MKLSLGFAFALLLKLHSLQLVTTQTEASLVKAIPEEWKRENDGTQPPRVDPRFLPDTSGNGEPKATNQTTPVTAMIPVPSLAADNVNTTVTTTPTPNILLNDTKNTTIQTNQTVIPNDNATSLVPPNITVTNSTLQNQTYTDMNSTTPSPESFTTNSTTSPAANFTTTRPSTNINSTTSAENVTNTTFSTPTTTLSTFSTVTNKTSPTNTTVLPNTKNQTTSVTTVTTNVSSTTINITGTTNVSSTTINITGDPLDTRGNSDTDGASGSKREIRGQAWGALLGIVIAVAIVLLVMYVIKKRRSYRDFSHRKLVEEMPQDPVLRLDNGEPLDLKPDGSAYYNPGVQGDSIQMTSFPRGQFHG